jgi:hypothetical protein
LRQSRKVKEKYMWENPEDDEDDEYMFHDAGLRHRLGDRKKAMSWYLPEGRSWGGWEGGKNSSPCESTAAESR